MNNCLPHAAGFSIDEVILNIQKQTLTWLNIFVNCMCGLPTDVGKQHTHAEIQLQSHHTGISKLNLLLKQSL